MKNQIILIVLIFFIVLIVLPISYAPNYYCCIGNNCICSATGNCYYQCDSGWFDENDLIDDGCENQVPLWLNSQVNNSNPEIRDVVSFNVNWTDTTGFNESLGYGISYTILSLTVGGPNCDQWVNVTINKTNYMGGCTGVINCSGITTEPPCQTTCGCDMVYPFACLSTGSPLTCTVLGKSACTVCSGCTWRNTTFWSNMTYQIPDKCAGKTIYWKQYANDTANRWNVNTQNYITVKKGWLNVTLLNPNPLIYNDSSQPLDWCYLNINKIKSEVECKGYRCGLINATVRRNSTSTNLIPINTAPDTPLSINRVYVRPINHSSKGDAYNDTEYCGSIPCYYNDSRCGYDRDFNDTNTCIDFWTPGDGYKHNVNYTYSLSATSATLFFRGLSIVQNENEKVQVYNFTSNGWYIWLRGDVNFPGTPSTYFLPVSTSSGLINSDGTLILNFEMSGAWHGIEISDSYVSYLGNNIPVGDLKAGEKRNVQWDVNVTSCDNNVSKINIIFNSSSLVKNETKNATVRTVSGSNVSNVNFNTSEFYYGDPLNCSSNVTDISNSVQKVYYKIYLNEHKNNPDYEGVINKDTDCKGSSWTNGKICSVVKNVQGLKGNWSCDIIAQCSCGNHSGYSPNATMKNTAPPKPIITKPANNTWFNKYQNPIQINCTNTTPDKNIEDYLNFTVSRSQNKLDWTTICYRKTEICNWTVDQSNEGITYLKCKAWDGTSDGADSDYITAKIDRTSPNCIFNPPTNNSHAVSYTTDGDEVNDPQNASDNYFNDRTTFAYIHALSFHGGYDIQSATYEWVLNKTYQNPTLFYTWKTIILKSDPSLSQAEAYIYLYDWVTSTFDYKVFSSNNEDGTFSIYIDSEYINSTGGIKAKFEAFASSTNFESGETKIYLYDTYISTIIIKSMKNEFNQMMESPYILSGDYNDGRSGMSNVTYRYYNGTQWKFLYTNTTLPYTFNWYVSNENPSIENKWIYINATCNDTAGNDNTSQSYVPVDLVNEFPSIWNLVIRNMNDNPISWTPTGNTINITVNVSDPDPVRNISYITGNFTWPNGTIVYRNLTEIQNKGYTHNWTYFIRYIMPYSPPNATINVTVYDKYGLTNSTNISLKISTTIALSFLNDTINFSTVSTGTEINATENQGWPLLIVVQGNTPINLSQRGDDLVGNIYSNVKIGIGNVSWNTTNETNIFTKLTSEYTTIENNITPCKNQSVYYKLKVPLIQPQYYSGNVTIKGDY